MWNTLVGRPRKPQACRTARPRLEALEERTTPTTVSWVNPGSGDWAVGANWSTGSVPGPNDDVVIDQPGATVTHSAGADSVHSLTEAARSGLELSGGALSFATTFQINGTLLLDGGSLDLLNKDLSGTGTVTNGPTSSWMILSGRLHKTAIQPTLDNQGYLETRAGVDLQGPFSNDAGATLEVVGDDAVGDSRTLRVANGFTNHGLIETSSTLGVAVSIGVTSGTLTNAADGAIHISGLPVYGLAILYAELNNQGTLTVDGPLDVTADNAAHASSGTINVTGDDLNVNGSGSSTSFTNTGSIFIASRRTLHFNNMQFYQNGGSITGTGKLHLHGASAYFAGDFTTNGLTLFYLEGDQASYNSDGLLTVSPGSELSFLRATAVNAALENDGRIVVEGATRFNGNFASDAGSTTEVLGNPYTSDSNLIVANGFTNHGTIVLSSFYSSYPSTLTVSAGALTNASDGIIEALVGTGGSRDLTVAAGGLINDGTVSLAAGTTLTVGGDFTQNSDGDLAVEIGLINDGTVSLGQLTVNGTANIDGTLSVYLVNGYTPPSGASFRVLTANQVNGTFATLDHDGALFTPTYDPADVTLVANTEPPAGRAPAR
jgi:hypothetical protein